MRPKQSAHKLYSDLEAKLKSFLQFIANLVMFRMLEC